MAEADKPKKHSALAQVVFRKTGEVMDLGGKALIGLSGLGHVLGDHDVRRLDWRWLGLVLLAVAPLRSRCACCLFLSVF